MVNKILFNDNNDNGLPAKHDIAINETHQKH